MVQTHWGTSMRMNAGERKASCIASLAQSQNLWIGIQPLFKYSGIQTIPGYGDTTPQSTIGRNMASKHTDHDHSQRDHIKTQPHHNLGNYFLRFVSHIQREWVTRSKSWIGQHTSFLKPIHAVMEIWCELRRDVILSSSILQHLDVWLEINWIDRFSLWLGRMVLGLPCIYSGMLHLGRYQLYMISPGAINLSERRFMCQHLTRLSHTC